MIKVNNSQERGEGDEYREKGLKIPDPVAIYAGRKTKKISR
jgi:hypothetical protein